MATNNDNETSAEQTYANRASDIARLIDVLQMELERHAQEASEKPKDWGYAGSLGKIRSDLLETLSFISGFTREDIENDFLAE